MNDPFATAVRQAAAALIPDRAFLKRDRDGALFVTNAPRMGPGVDWPEVFAAADLIAREENGLVRLIPGKSWLKKSEDEYPAPPDHLSSTLFRFRGIEPCPEALGLFALGLRVLDGESDPGYETRLRKLAAVCLREKTGGGLYACALVNHMIKRRDDP